jgi:hypothetical protein
MHVNLILLGIPPLCSSRLFERDPEHFGEQCRSHPNAQGIGTAMNGTPAPSPVKDQAFSDISKKPHTAFGQYAQPAMVPTVAGSNDLAVLISSAFDRNPNCFSPAGTPPDLKQFDGAANA